MDWYHIGKGWHLNGDGLALICCRIGAELAFGWCWVDIGLASDGNGLSSEWNGLTLHWKRIGTRLLLDWCLIGVGLALDWGSIDIELTWDMHGICIRLGWICAVLVLG